MLNSMTAFQVMFKTHTQEERLNQESPLIHTNALSKRDNNVVKEKLQSIVA